jgi:hypothetical protein
MKRIRLVNITPPDKSSVRMQQRLYSVYLGRGQVMKFSNLKAAQRFSQDYSDLITMLLHELNFCLAEAYTMYRAAWFYFSDERTRTNLIALETEISNNIRQAEDHLQRLVTRTAGSFGADLVKRFSQAAADCLCQTFAAIGSLLQRRSDYAGMKRAQLCQARVENAMVKVNAWIQDQLNEMNR